MERAFAAVVMSLCVLASPCRAEPPPAAGDVTRILPREGGATICFTGQPVPPAALIVEDWSQEAVTFEPVPNLSLPNGTPATRPVPKRTEGRVTGLVLSLAPSSDAPSEPYRFILSVTLKGRRTLRASGPCQPIDPVKTGLRSGAPGTAKALGCWVECDGGGVAVERLLSGEGLTLAFDRSGLRMTPGCSDEDDVFMLKATGAAEVVLHLSPAAPAACRALRAWDRSR